MDERAFEPGFRLSLVDVLVLVGGAAFVVWAHGWNRRLAWAAAFVLLHFFLFCNVVRMSRPLELLWAAAFAGLVVAYDRQLLTWPLLFGIAAALTVVLSIVEMRMPSYHGLGWRRINPQLESRWRAQHREPAADGERAAK